MSSPNQSSNCNLDISRLSMIVAMDLNRVIGHKGKMPWHLPIDLAHFRYQTLNKPIIMGHQTALSIGHALPYRTNIVLTRQKDLRLKDCLIANNIEEAISLAGDAPEIMIIGGKEVYQQLIHKISRLYITEIQYDFEGDTHFPDFSLTNWIEIERKSNPEDERNPYACDFILYQKRNSKNE